MLRGLDGYFRYPSPRRPTLRFSSSGVGRRSLAIFGGHSEGETPLPIPNRAVKPLRADGTWPSRAWESRSPPIYLHGPSRAGRPVVVPARGLRRRYERGLRIAPMSALA